MRKVSPSLAFDFFRHSLVALGLTSCSIESEKTTPVPHFPPATAIQEGSASSEIFGTVFFTGEIPPPRTWSTTSDHACLRTGRSTMQSEEILVNANGTLRNVFVYVSSGLGTRPFPVPGDSVILNQHGCRYIPHVFGIQAGQPLALLNSDSTFHNVYAAAKVNRPFNLGMTFSKKRLTRTFEVPEVMVPFRCNVHPWMASYAGVLDHPFYSVTDEAGAFRLGKLPPGEYEVTAWHERLGVKKQSVQLGESAGEKVDFTFETE